MRSRSHALCRARSRRHRRVDGSGDQGRTTGVRPFIPDALRGSHQERGGHRDHRGRSDLVLRRRQLIAARGPRRPLRARTRAPLRSAAGRSTPPPTRAIPDQAQSGRTHSRRAAASRRPGAATVPNPGCSSSAKARPAPDTAAGARQRRHEPARSRSLRVVFQFRCVTRTPRVRSQSGRVVPMTPLGRRT